VWWWCDWDYVFTAFIFFLVFGSILIFIGFLFLLCFCFLGKRMKMNLLFVTCHAWSIHHSCNAPATPFFSNQGKGENHVVPLPSNLDVAALFLIFTDSGGWVVLSTRCFSFYFSFPPVISFPALNTLSTCYQMAVTKVAAANPLHNTVVIIIIVIAAPPFPSLFLSSPSIKLSYPTRST
jgi:hypothetical protein